MGDYCCSINFGFNGNISVVKNFRMKIGSIVENLKSEKRVAITPEVAKKFIANNFEVSLQKNYAKHLGFDDKDYESINVKILDNEKEVFQNSEVLVQMNLPSKSLFDNFSQNKTLVGVLNPYQNKKDLEELVQKKVNCFSLELLPRITRAQSMDVLSSQANLAGYKAVVDPLVILKKQYQ